MQAKYEIIIKFQVAVPPCLCAVNHIISTMHTV